MSAAELPKATGRKLIEVALPLEAINRESAREKSIRHGHPSTLHLWWARRPLATARAVLFAQLVDDPSSHPDRFPTVEAQQVERKRLHDMIERLVVWENTRDQRLLKEAHEEILASTDGKPPPILDPFAGGGTIPLEAQRLGLEAHASDLNPVAVLINKALIEIPPRFAGKPPVFPGLAEERTSWEGATGLAADVSAYGEWVRDEAAKRISHHYPKAKLPNGHETTVIAWIWARTVICPNPACGIEMPLVRSWWLSKKKGKEAWVQPLVISDPDHLSGKRVEFKIGTGAEGAPTKDADGTVRKNGATCVACESGVGLDYVRDAGRRIGFSNTLMAMVAEGDRRRLFVVPQDQDMKAAGIQEPIDGPDADLPAAALGFRVQNYGLSKWGDLFADRQLLGAVTLSDLIPQARERVFQEAASQVSSDDAALYADAVATYLSCALVRVAMTNSNLTRWNPVGTKVQHMFGRQTVSMVWDFAETNPFATSTGSWSAAIEMATNALDLAPARPPAIVEQQDAAEAALTGAAVSTDPPYYDNVGYADLADFFYVWHRRALRTVHPSLFSTVLVPKSDELVANPHRQGGSEGAKKFFELGFENVFTRARANAQCLAPMTVYYAFKQSSSGTGRSASGWETLLEGMIRSGWMITATWPMRTEMPSRMRSLSSNALASSIVLALRPRPEDAPITNRRDLIATLQVELPGALRNLQQGAIAPVDLPQAAIGPGMAAFSRYSKVIEDDGSAMSVRSALARINEILDQVLSEQEGDFDSTTRFAIAWYRQHGYGTGLFGDADNIARARNTSVDTMDREGILESVAGKVTLLDPAAMPDDYDPLADDRISAWEVLHNLIAALERGGLPEAGSLLTEVEERPDAAIDPELVKELAFLLFSIAEKNGWTKDALAFNTIATAWPDVIAASRSVAEPSGTQAALDLEGES